MAEGALKLIDQAMAAGKQDIAKRAAAMALRAARKSDDDLLAANATLGLLDPAAERKVKLVGGEKSPAASRYIQILPRVELRGQSGGRVGQEGIERADGWQGEARGSSCQ